MCIILHMNHIIQYSYGDLITISPTILCVVEKQNWIWFQTCCQRLSWEPFTENCSAIIIIIMIVMIILIIIIIIITIIIIIIIIIIILYIYIYIYEFTRLAETRLAQNSILLYIKQLGRPGGPALDLAHQRQKMLQT